MPDDLGRYERMAQRAKLRAAIARDDQLTPAEQWHLSWVQREHDAMTSPRYLAGPPDGCHTCYRWCESPLGMWAWTHTDAVDPQVRPWGFDDDDEPPQPTTWCMHSCHGPNGLPLPVIAIG